MLLLLLLSCTALSPCTSTQVTGHVQSSTDRPLSDATVSHCDVDEPTECTELTRIGNTDEGGAFDVEVPGSSNGLQGCVFTNMVITHPDCTPVMVSVPMLWPDEAIQLDCRPT